MGTDRWLMAGVAAMYLLFAGTVRSSLRETAVRPGDPAPEFSAAQFGAKLLAVNFWATWCDGCVAEIPSLNRMQAKLAPEGLVVLAISVDDGAAYSAFLNQHPVLFRTMRDSRQEIERKFGTAKIPETYLIDPNGRVVQKFAGAQEWDSEAMMAYLRGLL